MVAGNVADDLTDIERDLREGLALLEDGRSDEEVMWSWWFSFWHHWGDHVVDSIRAIHRHVASDEKGL